MHQIKQKICRINVSFHRSSCCSDGMEVVCYIGPVQSILCVGFDEDLTNAVTKHACVSLWWHWSTVLVSWNVFRIWLMCFLLTPVTHVCGGCCVLVSKSEWIRCPACLKMPQNTAFPFKWSVKADKMMWKKSATCFDSLVRRCGGLPTYSRKKGGFSSPIAETDRSSPAV